MTAKQTTNEYVTIAQLRSIRPPEGDVSTDGRRFRVRGLMSGEVHRISLLAQNNSLPGGMDGELDRTLTVAFGLLKPDLRASEDLEAAQLIVRGLPQHVRNALAAKIVKLTINGKDEPETETAEDVPEGKPETAAA